MDTTIFNTNKNYTPESKSIFLQGGFGLLDSIHRPHPYLFDMYKLQKKMDWDEHEFPLAGCQVEFQSRPKHLCDKMLNTLAWQWEADSAAAHSLAPVVAPFLSDDDAWLAYQRISDNEGLHALSYSEIVKLGLGGDASQRMMEILQNQASIKRLQTVARWLGYVKRTGAKLTLNMIDRNSDEAIDAALIFVSTILALERMQFMPSFAVTFAIGELDAFMPIIDTVQKILMDEWTIHIPVGKYIIHNERQVARSVQSFARIRQTVETIFADIIKAELDWNRNYLHADGSQLAGVTPDMLDDWLLYGVNDVYETFGWKNPYKIVAQNPLSYMNDWVRINNNQGSPQEKKSGNYLMGGFVQSEVAAEFNTDDL